MLRDADGDAEYKLILGAMGDAANPQVLEMAVELTAKPGVRAEAEVAVKKLADSLRTRWWRIGSCPRKDRCPAERS